MNTILIKTYNGTVFVLLLFLTKIFSPGRCDIFAALSGLETLFYTEKYVIKSLEEYITMEKSRLSTLKRYSERLEGQQKRSENNQEHLGNPLYSLLVLKSLTIDYAFIMNLAENHTEYKRNETLIYPTREDIKGAIGAIVRLVQTHHLNVTDLARGNLKGHFSSPLTASDCFEIGLLIKEVNDWENIIEALPWFIEALEQHQTVESFQQTQVHEIIDQLVACYKGSGLKKHTKELSHLRNIRKSKSDVLALLRDELAEKVKKERLRDQESVKLAMKKPLGSKRDNKDALMSIFKAHCRGEITISPRISKSLSCRFQDGAHPFLFLAPVKLEELYRDPLVVLFHDVISTDEIQHLKAIAAPNLTRANIVIHPNSPVHSKTGRLSKISWLTDSSSEIVARISRRVSHLTGLDLESAEELQVAEYGIGGYFLPHHDYPKLPNATPPPTGGRIATVMFYLSDVEEGGATVFTELGLTVYPKRGSALMWMNLHPSGEWHQGTYHGGCPVLKGNKWVANKWLHEVGQELIKPCPVVQPAAH